MEYQLKSVREEYEESLSMTLADSLKKHNKQSNYWGEKLSAMNARNELLEVT